MMTTAGRNDSAVISASTCRVRLYSWLPSGLVVTVTADMPCWARAGWHTATTAAASG
ncbi:hypothetical protein MBH78_12360 [Oceanimonas sp. NS1]|nr:hypothetical protein [Oceanimonas sp. NS1]